ncbi:hypothetical protein [Paenibacillus mesotrionivorans]|uniref:Uncharacterized protein n=1 Tax=Paenibacillus mesotrionivorans TaxID=3160968 RepID=A0ACC7NX45_9BACL
MATLFCRGVFVFKKAFALISRAIHFKIFLELGGMMKFIHDNFSCDVDVFCKEQEYMFRFYDGFKEQTEKEIINLVIVDPGYGYLFLKIKGDSALLGGYLDETVFHSDEMIEATIHFLETYIKEAKNLYIPYHVARVRRTSFLEYNGEY